MIKTMPYAHYVIGKENSDRTALNENDLYRHSKYIECTGSFVWQAQFASESEHASENEHALELWLMSLPMRLDIGKIANKILNKISRE